MNRRSSLLALMLALLVTLAGSRIFAQTEASSMDPETKAKIQEHLQTMSSELNLTDAQKEQLKPILQNEFQQLKATKDDSSLSQDQKQAKMQEIHQSVKSQMGSILTPEQQKKLAEMKEANQEH